MGRVITPSAKLPSSIMTVTLDAVQYRMRFTWRERPAAWYLDLYDAAEEPLALGLRLSPGWAPLAGLSVPDGPPGTLLVRGPDPYVREDLGVALRLVYFSVEDYPDATPEPDAPTIVVA